jgi:tetratricopeptide (TPR) repeat protein
MLFFSGPIDGQAAGTTQTESRERFDYLVRGDFFAGMAGDQARFDRAMRLCEDTLAKNPNHAEALVWHGGGLIWLSSLAFQKADVRKGVELWDRGLKEMDRAVELQPANVAVLIPRGAVLLPASQFVPDAAVKRALLEKAIGDYEKVLEIQKPYFGKLSTHARSELLFGLAEGSTRLGKNDKARAYFQRIVDECKGSLREKQATTWLEKGTLPATDAMSCSGCHTK